MRYVGLFTPQANPSGTFDLTARKGKFVFSNESCSNLLVTFSNGFSRKIPAGIASLVCLDQPATTITYSTISQLNIPCIDACDVDFYESSESLPEQYPSSLVRQTIIGNGINLGTSAVDITNLANNPGTSIITAQPNDVAVGFTWSADNSGNLTIKSDNAGALTQLFQLVAGASPSVIIGAIGVPTTIPGNLTVNGNIVTFEVVHTKTTGSGAAQAGGFYGRDSTGTQRRLLHLNQVDDNDAHIMTTPAHGNLKVTRSDYSGDIATFNDTAGVTLNTGSVNFLAGSLSRIKFGAATNVTNAGQTITHGLGVQPDVVFCTLDNVGVNETAQAANLSPTTFTISTSGTTNRTVWWIALKA